VVVEVVSTAVVLAVAVVSMGEGSVVVFMVAASALAVLQAESACAAVESALADPASQAATRTLLANVRGSLQWVIHHLDSLSLMDGLIDPLPLTLPAIAPQWLQQRVLRKHFRNADRTDGSTITLLNVTTEIGTAIGTGGMHISITVTSLSLSTASGAD
jgi:hypothetical protein